MLTPIKAAKRMRLVRQFRRFLREKGACSDARKWAYNKTMAEAWRDCENANWLLWLAGAVLGWEIATRYFRTVLRYLECTCETCLPRRIKADQIRSIFRVEQRQV